MDVRAAFVAHAQAPKALEPSQGALDHPAVAAQALAVALAAAGDAWGDAASGATPPGGERSRSPCRRAASWAGGAGGLLDRRWAAPHQGLAPAAWSRARWPRRAPPPAAARHALPSGGASCPRGCGRPDSGRFFAPLLPPPLARARAPSKESTAARLQSSRTASARRWSKTWCRRSHTPASCQSRKRRQHVMPEPQPISGGSSSHGVPVRSTKTMPASTARSEMRGLPPRGRSGAGGKGDSTSFHNASLASGLARHPTYQKTWFC